MSTNCSTRLVDIFVIPGGLKADEYSVNSWGFGYTYGVYLKPKKRLPNCHLYVDESGLAVVEI